MMHDQSPLGWFNDFFWIVVVPAALAALALWLASFVWGL